jgi:hypothetical protein
MRGPTPCRAPSTSHPPPGERVLNYSAGVGPAWCAQDAFSTTDPSLRPLTNADVAPAAYFGLKYLAPARSASPLNRMTFTLNLTRCVAAAGLSFDPGTTQTLTVQAIAPNANDSAQQFLSFTRE